jgi:hypothetical protein
MIINNMGNLDHRHSNSGPPFFFIWSLPRLWYGSLSGSISLNHLSIFYNISCYNSLVLITFVSRSSCRFTCTYNEQMRKKGGSEFECLWSRSIDTGNIEDNRHRTKTNKYWHNNTTQKTNRTELLLVWNPYTKDCYQNNTLNTKQSKY